MHTFTIFCFLFLQHDYSNVRKFAYKDSEVFVLCYSVVDRTSFESVRDFWIPEVKSFLGTNFPIILVATQVDLRYSAQTTNMKPVSTKEGEELASSIKAYKFVETSALYQEDIGRLFENIVCSGLKYRKKKMTMIKRLFHR